jgi:hypothetical protein
MKQSIQLDPAVVDSSRRGERTLADIKADEVMAGSRAYGSGPAEAYARLQKDSELGRYASPVENRRRFAGDEPIPAGDLGQFLMGVGGKNLNEDVEQRVKEKFKRPEIERRAKGGKVRAYAKGGSVRGGGCEQRGKTKGRFV